MIVKREPHLFVLDFKGSIDAKEVASLREEVTAILAVAREGDEVLLRLESGGGMVHGYGLASSQLDRIKAANLPLTIAVDKVGGKWWLYDGMYCRQNCVSTLCHRWLHWCDCSATKLQ